MNFELKRKLFVLVLLLAGAGIFAQTNPGTDAETEAPAAGEAVAPLPPGSEPSFKLSETDSGALFLQRLAWEKARYAVRYLVVLERRNSATGIWSEVLRKDASAESNYIDISVPAGLFRYRVSSYNVLDQLDKQTDWEEFSVIQALPPSILEFSPSAFYFDRLTPRIITLIGENLLPDTDMYLISKTMIDAEGNPVIIKPLELHRNELGETARLIFNDEDLVAGKYEIFAKNPGGLETRAGEFSIALAKPFDINVSGGYIPMLTLFGREDFFLDKVFIPLSFAARVSYIPFKWKFGNLGAEFNTSWSYLSSSQTTALSHTETSANLVTVSFGVLFQYWLLPRRLSLNGRLGLGFAGIFNFRFVNTPGGKGQPMNFAAFTYNIGASVQWLFFKQIYMEGCVDFVHVAHRDVPMGFVRIGIFGGYQF